MALRQYATPEEINGLGGAPDGLGFVDCWAWIDEDGGLVRARVFVDEEGIPEDEATGAAALRLGAQLGRPIEIRQGEGSVLHARPGPDGTIEVGGRVLYVAERPYG
jgi:predicted PhzF superfamily epimerase YddE/YHI9